MRQLRQLLTRRLKDMTGKEPKAAKAAETIPVAEVVPDPFKALGRNYFLGRSSVTSGMEYRLFLNAP
jgi:hypothetical protein